MKRQPTRLAYAVVVVLAIAGAASCPDSDVINTGTYEVAFETVAVGDADWACVLMTVGKTWVKPVDGTCETSGTPCFDDSDCTLEECVGGLAIDSLPGTALEVVSDEGLQFANFSDQGRPCEELTESDSGFDFDLQVLSTGTYKLTDLTISSPGLVASDGTFTACSGYSLNVAESAFYQDSLLFRVGENEPNRVRLVIDAEALAEALADADCVPNLQGDKITRVFSIE